METVPKVKRIEIRGELSIFTATVLRQQLLDAFDGETDVEVDLSAVSEMDTCSAES